MGDVGHIQSDARNVPDAAAGDAPARDALAGAQTAPGDGGRLEPDEPRVIEIFVEIPKGSRNKYEWDHASRRFRLDRMLFSAVHYPGDYGFVLDTFGEDGDPLDALVILGDPTFPGCVITSRVVGVFWMTDDKGRDTKIITVPDSDPRWAALRELEDVPRHLLDEIGHFFSIYKDLERKTVTVEGFGSRLQALDEVASSRKRFATMDHPPAMP